MIRWLCLLLLPLPAFADTPVSKERLAVVDGLVAKQLPDLLTLYKQIHANPELSFEEVRTAAKVAELLKAEGIEVTTGVGKTGVVGLLKNGPGPVVLVRADMDALPVVEKTGVPYASQVRTRTKDGIDVGVMHACGHDMHVTCLIGTACTLVAMKDQWSGTILFIAQPAEEIGAGARAMIADKLFERFPKPAYALGLHCDGRYPHGHISYREGQMQANVDSVDILVRGKGGHGASPHVTIDPIVIAAKLVIDLQTIVSREQAPTDPAVVTVGSIHGGTKHNIIPDDVKLQLTIRTTTDATREKVLAAIERKAKAAAMAANAPEPIVTVNQSEYTPSLFNDPPLTRKMITLLSGVLGENNMHERGMSMGGEDFSQYVRQGIPGFYFSIGTVAPEKYEESKKTGAALPNLHSDSYAPVPEPSIRTGVKSMSACVLHLLGK